MHQLGLETAKYAKKFEILQCLKHYNPFMVITVL